VLDEAASILKRSDVSKQIVPIIEQTGQEGHGYNMSLIMAIHDFSKDGLGDVRIRDYLNDVICHRMAQTQSKFIDAFRSGKIGKQKAVDKIAGLMSGHAIVRDEFQELEYLILPYADSSDALVAKQELARISAPMNRKQIVTGSLLVEQKAGEQEIAQESTEDQVTEEDASKMHDAYLALLKVKTAREITRTDIMKQAGFTRYKWNVIKRWCDLRGVGVSNSN
jgi:hypothetical protein